MTLPVRGAPIDLDALEALAGEAPAGPLARISVPPATVAALVRAVKAALENAEVNAITHQLDAALAPFCAPEEVTPA